ncbi:MAG: DUF3810 domain-containing protein [Gemmatimonadetes bacterium]|nr:DUF3810 domain-containing protein [Gemmatimonadota bacterium]
MRVGWSGTARSRDARLTPRPPLRLRRYLLGAMLGVMGWVGYWLLSSNPAVAEFVAGSGPVPWLRRYLSRATGIAPFSLAEFVVIAVALRQGIGLARGTGTIRRREDGARRTIARGGLRFAHDVGILVFLFYVLWGFQYARPNLATRLGIEPGGEVSTDELRSLAARSVEITNELYREIHHRDDAGEPTAAPALRSLVPALEEGWSRVQAQYDLPASVSSSFGAPKGFLATPLVKRLGLAGVHFPYTGEALVLRDLPGVLLGKELGHEMAHQRGFASEADANVLGFLAAKESPDPILRYAAYSFLQRQLVLALQGVSTEGASVVTGARLPGVERDLQDLNLYWEPARTPVAAVATRVNDAMLRSHGIEEGVGSYAGSTWVFIALARERGADALF